MFLEGQKIPDLCCLGWDSELIIQTPIVWWAICYNPDCPILQNPIDHSWHGISPYEEEDLLAAQDHETMV